MLCLFFSDVRITLQPDIAFGGARVVIRQIRNKIIDAILLRTHRNDVAQRQLKPRFGELPPEMWGLDVDSAGELCVAGWSVRELAEEHGSPLYIVDEERLKQNYHDFRAAFTKHYPKIDIGYSYKTNPLPGAIKILHDAGASAEVISEFELWLACELGVPPDRIIFNGPGKTVSSLEKAVSLGVKLINVDSVDEIERINALAAQQNRVQAVALRVVTSQGWSAQFGIPIAGGLALDAFRKMKEASHLDPCGLHMHLGTGLKDPDTYFKAVQDMLDLGVELAESLDIRIRHYDLGGGFGVPTVKPFEGWDTRLLQSGRPAQLIDPAAAPDISVYAKGIAKLFAQYVDTADPDCPEIVLEPGRAVSSSAQMLAVRVLTVKEDESRRLAIVDGGKNICIPLGYEYHEILPANKMREPQVQPYDVFGPLCHPNDLLVQGKMFPRLEAGDTLAVMDAGAYFVPNQRNFSNPRPAAVIVSRGKSRVTRKPERFEHIVALDADFSPDALS